MLAKCLFYHFFDSSLAYTHIYRCELVHAALNPPNAQGTSRQSASRSPYTRTSQRNLLHRTDYSLYQRAQSLAQLSPSLHLSQCAPQAVLLPVYPSLRLLKSNMSAIIYMSQRRKRRELIYFPFPPLL